MSSLPSSPFNLVSPLLSPRRSPEQCSTDAPGSPRSERHSHGSQRWRHDPLHAGPQLHHRPHLPRIRLGPLGRHGTRVLRVPGVCLHAVKLETPRHKCFILEFSAMLMDRTCKDVVKIPHEGEKALKPEKYSGCNTGFWYVREVTANMNNSQSCWRRR